MPIDLKGLPEAANQSPRDERGTPNPVDVHVGARIRMRRRILNLTQSELAQQLGLTFQQVQKYERGANRVSASKLYEIARALQTTIAYFFEGLAGTDADADHGDARGPMRQLITTPGGLELARLFPQSHRLGCAAECSI